MQRPNTTISTTRRLPRYNRPPQAPEIDLSTEKWQNYRMQDLRALLTRDGPANGAMQNWCVEVDVSKVLLIIVSTEGELVYGVSLIGTLGTYQC